MLEGLGEWEAAEMGNDILEMFAADWEYVFGKSRVVELGRFRAGHRSVGWPFILCLHSSGLCLFPSEFRPPSTFKKKSWFG